MAWDGTLLPVPSPGLKALAVTKPPSWSQLPEVVCELGHLECAWVPGMATGLELNPGEPDPGRRRKAF